MMHKGFRICNSAECRKALDVLLEAKRKHQEKQSVKPPDKAIVRFMQEQKMTLPEVMEALGRLEDEEDEEEARSRFLMNFGM